MRRALPALASLLACCAMPPRVDDLSTPAAAYETFRGAVARAEHDREFACLNGRLRRQLGIEDRGSWQEARGIVLTQGHPAIRGIIRSEVTGPPEMLDGRALLRVRLKYLIFAREGRVWLRPEAVLRVYREGAAEPEIYAALPSLALFRTDKGAGVRMPPDLVAQVGEIFPGGRIGRLEAAIEWFLDDFAVGKDTPDTVREERQREQVE